MDINIIKQIYYEKGFNAGIEKIAVYMPFNKASKNLHLERKAHALNMERLERKGEYAAKEREIYNAALQHKTSVSDSKINRFIGHGSHALSEVADATGKVMQYIPQKQPSNIGTGIAIGAGGLGAGMIGIHALKARRDQQQQAYYNQ